MITAFKDYIYDCNCFFLCYKAISLIAPQPCAVMNHSNNLISK